MGALQSGAARSTAGLGLGMQWVLNKCAFPSLFPASPTSDHCETPVDYLKVPRF